LTTLRNRRSSLLLAIFLVSAAWLIAAETPIPPLPTRWVTDTANFMSPDALRALDARLEQYERSTGHQLIVWIGTTTGDAPIDDWAVRAFEKWKVGRKGIDDGLVLFIMSADRRLRFEVGYGLEGEVPDAIAARIINDVIVPRIQKNDRDGAVTAGMDAVMTVIGGGGIPAQTAERGAPAQRRGISLLNVIIGLLVLAFVITNPRLAFLILASMSSGGGHGRHRGGGGWGGGGGFSGGGGRSGGGGASGSW
jgi:uncharacterized protein